ncbi:MAG: type IV-A pilus assembly ATPase PilB, partial [Gammaproteobacteria bacterium]
MDGLIEEAEATKAHEMALKKRTHFVSYLVDSKILSSQDIAWSGAQEFGVPLFDIAAMDMEVAPVRLVSEKLIKQH